MTLIKRQNKYFKGKPDRRQISRIKLASIVSMDSSKWDLELSKPVNAREMEQLLDCYSDTSLECNIFFEKTFLSAAFCRMNTRETNLLTVWESVGTERHLRMYFPVVQGYVGLPFKRSWRCWSHDYAPLGVPMVSEHDAGEVLDRFIQLMGQIERPPFPALILADIPLDGVFAMRMREALESSGTPYCQNVTGDRVVLNRDISGLSNCVLEINSKMRRNYQRQLRRLGEKGDLHLEMAKEYEDVILRFEEFMLLEAKGWKGNKGSSMHTIKQTAAFARQAVTELAKDGHCAIYSIRLDGKSIASLVVLQSQGVYFPWKIAFDHEYSSYSPGALLMFKVSQEIGSRADFVRADSLAGSRNQLVNVLWKRRMRLGAMILPMGDTLHTSLEKVSRALQRKQNLINWVKKLLKK